MYFDITIPKAGQNDVLVNLDNCRVLPDHIPEDIIHQCLMLAKIRSQGNKATSYGDVFASAALKLHFVSANRSLESAESAADLTEKNLQLDADSSLFDSADQPHKHLTASNATGSPLSPGQLFNLNVAVTDMFNQVCLQSVSSVDTI